MRANAIEGILANYSVLLQLFDNTSDVSEPAVKSRMIGTAQLLKDFHTFFGKYKYLYTCMYIIYAAICQDKPYIREGEKLQANTSCYITKNQTPHCNNKVGFLYLFTFDHN